MKARGMAPSTGDTRNLCELYVGNNQTVWDVYARIVMVRNKNNAIVGLREDRNWR